MIKINEFTQEKLNNLNQPIMSFRIKLCYLFKVTTLDLIVTLSENKKDFDQIVRQTYQIVLGKQNKVNEYENSLCLLNDLIQKNYKIFSINLVCNKNQYQRENFNSLFCNEQLRTFFQCFKQTTNQKDLSLLQDKKIKSQNRFYSCKNLIKDKSQQNNFNKTEKFQLLRNSSQNKNLLLKNQLLKQQNAYEDKIIDLKSENFQQQQTIQKLKEQKGQLQQQMLIDQADQNQNDSSEIIRAQKAELQQSYDLITTLKQQLFQSQNQKELLQNKLNVQNEFQINSAQKSTCKNQHQDVDQEIVLNQKIIEKLHQKNHKKDHFINELKQKIHELEKQVIKKDCRIESLMQQKNIAEKQHKEEIQITEKLLKSSQKKNKILNQKIQKEQDQNEFLHQQIKDLKQQLILSNEKQLSLQNRLEEIFNINHNQAERNQILDNFNNDIYHNINENLLNQELLFEEIQRSTNKYQLNKLQ